MKNHQIMDLARKVRTGAHKAAGSFLIPGPMGEVIKDTADLLYELAKREVQSDAEGN